MMRPAVIIFALLLFPGWLGAQQSGGPPAPTAAPGNSQSSDPRAVLPPKYLPPTVIQVPEDNSPSNNYEDWTAEITPGVWLFNPTGTITSQSVSQDMKSDLGIAGWKTQPWGRITGKLGKNKVTLEGTRYQLFGGRTVQETITVAGHTGTIDDSTQTTVHLAYIYLGYERDLFSGPHGFFGFTGGIAYLQTKSELDDVTRMLDEVDHNTGALPIFGGTGRYYPLHSYIFNINGESRGMSFGNYGFFLQSSGNFGFSPTKNFTIQVGYSRMGMDLHDKYVVSGIRTVFKGPTASLQFRIR